MIFVRWQLSIKSNILKKFPVFGNAFIYTLYFLIISIKIFLKGGNSFQNLKTKVADYEECFLRYFKFSNNHRFSFSKGGNSSRKKVYA